ncbi:MAG: methyltransferase domain-containing protein [Proteobacteria bacterium]|nr:methyltransferase domain-containing protein [Pseudomonadota bacterium]
MTMELEDIRRHWQNWAVSFGKDLRATTKGQTAKMIEIAAIGRVVDMARTALARPLRILEVGCGNGFNCSWVAQTHADCHVTGIDYIPEMIEAAKQRQAEDGIDTSRLTYLVGNALELDNLTEQFDVIFTDRCLINLNSWGLQERAYRRMASLLGDGAFLATIENSLEARERQSQLRTAMNLSDRPIDKFNTFIADSRFEQLARDLGLSVVTTQNISTLHDLLLYVLLPMINGGTVDYEHPLIEAAARLNIALTGDLGLDMGPIGQNRLVVCQRVKRF